MYNYIDICQPTTTLDAECVEDTFVNQLQEKHRAVIFVYRLSSLQQTVNTNFSLLSLLILNTFSS
jgi:hypothetical protein